MDVSARNDRWKRYEDILRRSKAHRVERCLQTVIKDGSFRRVRPPTMPNDVAVELFARLAEEGLAFVEEVDLDEHPGPDRGGYFTVHLPNTLIDGVRGAGAAVVIGMIAQYMPDLVWRLRRVTKQEVDTELFMIADGESDHFAYALYAYDMLPQRGQQVFVVDHPFVRPFTNPWRSAPSEQYCAIGVINGDVMVSLESFVPESRTGTRILNHWKQTRGRLIGHHVLPHAESYFHHQGFYALPKQPTPAGHTPFSIMAWNYPVADAVATVNRLGLPWSRITPPGSEDVPEFHPQEYARFHVVRN